MPIAVECGCGRRLKARDDLAGEAFACPGCGREVRVPRPLGPATVETFLASAVVVDDPPETPSARAFS